jgi:hypothetical protein
MMDGKKLQPENIKATIIKCVIENRESNWKSQLQ